MIGVSHIGIAAHRGGGGTIPPDLRFISTWDTTKTSSGSSTTTQVKLPLISTGSYNFTVEWGDGNSDTITAWNQAAVTHTYATSGVYQIIIDGTINGFQFNNAGDKNKIKLIENWGTLALTTGRCFHSCANLDVTATDAPTISTTDFTTMFYNCDALTTPDFSNWNTSGVTLFTDCFNGSLLFNGDVEGWVTAAATNIDRMLSNCPAYVGGQLNWNTTNVRGWVEVFKNSTSFNGDVSNWVVVGTTSQLFNGCTSFVGTGVDTWTTSGLTNAMNMFTNCTLLNTNISVWNTNSLTNVTNMLYNADGYTYGLIGWNINSITTYTGFMQNATGMSTANYDATLISWAAQTPQSGKAVNFGGSKYTLGGAAAAARAYLITNFGWTITDGGGI